MTTPRFVQLHTLTSYPATLLNRDDAGFAKRMPFGGTNRTRISSQCLKYHWRNFDGEQALYRMDVPHSYRSRETFRRKVAVPLVEQGVPERLAIAYTHALKESILSGKEVSKSNLETILNPKEKDDPWKLTDTQQVTIFGEPEVEHLKSIVMQHIEEHRDALDPYYNGEDAGGVEDLLKRINEFAKNRETKANLKALKMASGLDAAMFGRMVTSDHLSRGDAAIHVAHAMTTHSEESESDYFSAVDELRRDSPEESGELGAGHINSTELTSGLYYGYVVIDVPLLVSNLEAVSRSVWKSADRSLAKEVLKRMTHLIATVTPGAKLGSTAPYSYADFLMVELGNEQPRTLANAFRKAVRQDGDGVLANSYSALADHLRDADRMYGKGTERRLAAMHLDDDLLEPIGVNGTESVSVIADWIADQIGG